MVLFLVVALTRQWRKWFIQTRLMHTGAVWLPEIRMNSRSSILHDVWVTKIYRSACYNQHRHNGETQGKKLEGAEIREKNVYKKHYRVSVPSNTTHLQLKSSNTPGLGSSVKFAPFGAIMPFWNNSGWGEGSLIQCPKNQQHQAILILIWRKPGSLYYSYPCSSKMKEQFTLSICAALLCRIMSWGKM